MKQLCRACALLVFAVIAFAGSDSLFAFNPAAHALIAQATHPGVADRIDLRYGSLAPDIAWFVTDPAKWPTAGEDTHGGQFDELKPASWSVAQKAFAQGWRTHSQVDGADFVAHIQWNGQTPGYVVQKAVLLISQPGIPPEVTVDLAHTVVEAAIDLLVKEQMDPQIGQKVLLAVLFRSPQDKALLDSTFVFTTHRTDWLTLTQTELRFRVLTFQYASALAASSLANPSPMIDFAQQLASTLYGIQITTQQAQAILSAAVALCANDYQDAIQDAINLVNAQ